MGKDYRYDFSNYRKNISIDSELWDNLRYRLRYNGLKNFKLGFLFIQRIGKSRRG